MKKLTDEQLSRVLGEADAGLLDHELWQARADWAEYPCGCAAGAALILSGELYEEDDVTFEHAHEISAAIGEPHSFKYPPGAEAVLRMLEDRGLA